MDIHLVRSPLTFGILVRNARLEQELSQAATAARAQVSRSWLARVEDGHPGAELGPRSTRTERTHRGGAQVHAIPATGEPSVHRPPNRPSSGIWGPSQITGNGMDSSWTQV